MAERLRETVEQAEFDGEDAMPGGRFTVSIGVATYPTHAQSQDELLAHADRALYQAKSQGKNAVVLYGGESVN
jgi:diguanylate cyclase (GGDEF)-like protein